MTLIFILDYNYYAVIAIKCVISLSTLYLVSIIVGVIVIIILCSRCKMDVLTYIFLNICQKLHMVNKNVMYLFFQMFLLKYLNQSAWAYVKLFISDLIDYATIRLPCCLCTTLVGFRFNGELGIWGNVVPHPLLLYLIDPFDWQGPDRAPSLMQTGRMYSFIGVTAGISTLTTYKEYKSAKKRQRHRSWQAFSKLSFIANVSFDTLTSRKRQTLGPVVLQWPNMGLMVTRKSGRSCKCC